eukprot:s2688_g1.t1
MSCSAVCRDATSAVHPPESSPVKSLGSLLDTDLGTLGLSSAKILGPPFSWIRGSNTPQKKSESEEAIQIEVTVNNLELQGATAAPPFHGARVKRAQPFEPPAQPQNMSLTGNLLIAGNSLVRGVQFAHEDVEPRTVMRNVKPEDRTRPHGGGRHSFSMNRKPVLAYSIADKLETGKISEPAGSVLRRMRVMLDEEYVNMASLRQQYFRPTYRVGKWRADYNMRLSRRNRLRRVKEKFEQAWDQWMRSEGRRMGLTEPVRFSGPKLGAELTEELDAATNPEDVMKALPTKQELRMNKKYRTKGWSNYLPEDMFPGQWNDDGEDSLHKLFRRPLHKYPYDISKRGTNHVVRGIVF